MVHLGFYRLTAGNLYFIIRCHVDRTINRNNDAYAGNCGSEVISTSGRSADANRNSCKFMFLCLISHCLCKRITLLESQFNFQQNVILLCLFTETLDVFFMSTYGALFHSQYGIPSLGLYALCHIIVKAVFALFNSRIIDLL